METLALFLSLIAASILIPVFAWTGACTLSLCLAHRRHLSGGGTLTLRQFSRARRHAVSPACSQV